MRLREADPTSYQRAREVLGSKHAPRGHQQPMVLGALLDLADADRALRVDGKALRAAVVLRPTEVVHALARLVQGGWIRRRTGGGYILLPKAFGETGAAT